VLGISFCEISEGIHFTLTRRTEMTVIYSPQLIENRSIKISQNDLTFLNAWGIFEYKITS